MTSIREYVDILCYEGIGDISPLVTIARIQFAMNDMKAYETTLKKIYKLFSSEQEVPTTKKKKQGQYCKKLGTVTYYESGKIYDSCSQVFIIGDSWIAKTRQPLEPKQPKTPKGLTSLRWDICMKNLSLYDLQKTIISSNVFDNESIDENQKRNEFLINLSFYLLSGFNSISKLKEKNLKSRSERILPHNTEIIPFLRWIEARNLLPEDQKYVLNYGNFFSNNKISNEEYDKRYKDLIKRVAGGLNTLAVHTNNSYFGNSAFYSSKRLCFSFLAYEDCKALYDVFLKYRGKRYDVNAIHSVYAQIMKEQNELLKTMSLKCVVFDCSTGIFGYSEFNGRYYETIMRDKDIDRLKTVSRTLRDISKTEPDLHELLTIFNLIDDTFIFPEDKQNAEPE